MNCEAFETLLADYFDGTLPVADQLALERHAEVCPGCREYMAEVGEGFNALKSMPPATPPPELVTRIAYLAPVEKIVRPGDHVPFLQRVASKWLRPVLQPRFAMGMAMTFLSFTMMERCTGLHSQRIEPADLNPASIAHNAENRVLRVRDRAVKYYQNLRIVYEAEMKLRQLQQSRDQSDGAQRRPADKSPEQAPRKGAK